MAGNSEAHNTSAASVDVSLGQTTSELGPVDFEKLLADLSASFVRVSVDEVDQEIEQWLQRIVLAMDIDRSTVVQVDLGDGGIYTTHQWAREGVSAPERGRRVDDTASYPWLTHMVRSGEVAVISSLYELPPEASKDRESFRRDGNQSNVTIPLRIAGVVVGAVLFGAVLSEREWSLNDVQRLKLVAEVFGNALERKRAEAEIRRLSSELRRVSQAVAMGALTAAVAHELNQPLAAILSNARAVRRMIAADPPRLEEVDAAMDDIIRDNVRAAEIVRDIRALFKGDEAKKSSVDVREILTDVCRIVKTDAQMKGISLLLQTPDSIPLVRGDKMHLTQGILNLVFNAFDSVYGLDGPREVALRAFSANNDRVHVAVRDSGKGIDPKMAQRLFEPFFTTKSTGMGMGLAIARSIIENHGGRIWAASNHDHGATFELELPVETRA